VAAHDLRRRSPRFLDAAVGQRRPEAHEREHPVLDRAEGPEVGVPLPQIVAGQQFAIAFTGTQDLLPHSFVRDTMTVVSTPRP
jgi:hypothetical protein